MLESVFELGRERRADFIARLIPDDDDEPVSIAERIEVVGNKMQRMTE